MLVTNGVYATGSRNLWSLWLSRVVVTNAIRLESVNGPGVTLVDGGRRVNGDGVVTAGTRCVYLGNGAVLSGFTLTNGAAGHIGEWVEPTRAEEGGGVLAEPSAVITNCVIARNLAKVNGGGACGGKLYDCVLTNNVANGPGDGGFTGESARGAARMGASCIIAGSKPTGVRGMAAGPLNVSWRIAT